MKISVFTDLRFAISATPTGVGKHILHISRGLADTPECLVSLLAASDQAANPGVLSFLPLARLPLSWKVSSALWALTSRPNADQWCGDADWVYCPKNDWIPLRTKRLAVTIHGAHELDPAISHSAHPLWWLYRLRNRVQYCKMCRHANVIFVVSEFLKKQVCDWFGADHEKVVVVGNGVEPVYFGAGKTQSSGWTRSVVDKFKQLPGLPSTISNQSCAPYILCAGGLNFLDGGDRVIALGREIRRRNLDFRILVAGCQHEHDLPQQAAATGVIDLLGYVQAEQLALLLRGAVAFYFPTRYETFGMAAAEAMAVGTPVITCRSTAVPEIVGKAGCYVDTDAPYGVMEAILAVWTDPVLRTKHVQCGQQRAAAYTWETCVGRVYRELALRMQDEKSK